MAVLVIQQEKHSPQTADLELISLILTTAWTRISRLPALGLPI